MRKPHGSFWTEERDAILTRLCATGISYRDIGRELGCTRNAAIGRARRIGIDVTHVRPAAEPRVRAPKRRPGASTSLPPRVGLTTVRHLRERREAVSTRVVEETSAHVVRHHGAQAREIASIMWVEEVTDTMACWECFDPRTCHWPVRGSPHQFCGAPQARYNNRSKWPYCERHLDRARSSIYSRGETT